MYRSNYDWDNYFSEERPSYADWLFDEQLTNSADRLREQQAMEDLIMLAYLRQHYKNHRYDAGGIMGGISSAADLVTDIAGDWQTVKNSGKEAENNISKNLNNQQALQAVTSGNLYDTSSVDAFMKSSSAAQSNLANVRDATMKDAGGKENAFLNGFVASNRDALKGATSGVQFGGPWGAAIGGIAGGIAGAMTGIFGSKKINKKRRAAVDKYNKTYNANSIQQMYANSQANAADTVNRKQQLAAKSNLVAMGGRLQGPKMLLQDFDTDGNERFDTVYEDDNDYDDKYYNEYLQDYFEPFSDVDHEGYFRSLDQLYYNNQAHKGGTHNSTGVNQNYYDAISKRRNEERLRQAKIWQLYQEQKLMQQAAWQKERDEAIARELEILHAVNAAEDIKKQNGESQMNILKQRIYNQ